MWEKLYDEPGFGIWLANFRDTFMDEAANAEFSEFIADKIRAPGARPGRRREADPQGPRLRRAAGAARDQLLRGLQPGQRPPGRPPGDADRADHRPGAIQTTERDYEFDIIVYATGFDAITGSYRPHRHPRRRRADRSRTSGRTRPSTYLGMQVHGFPNLLMPTGPQSGSASTNYPRGIEMGVNL